MDTDERTGLGTALEAVDAWPVETVAAAVVGPEGVLATRGDLDHRFALASVTKLLVATAALVAVEEEAISLDDAAGPEGSTVRHLLAHASGVDFADRERVRCAPGTRRIYSSAGYEILADHVAGATSIAFAEYLRGAVCEPLGMDATSLDGPAGHGAHSTVRDLARVAVDFLAPTLVAGQTWHEATSVQFEDLDGVVPGYGMQKPCPWGLGPEIKGEKGPHWTGHRNSAATFGHFGQSGTFCWVDPDAGLALVVLTDRDFGEWAEQRWPELSDAVLDAAAGQPT